MYKLAEELGDNAVSMLEARASPATASDVVPEKRSTSESITSNEKLEKLSKDATRLISIRPSA